MGVVITLIMLLALLLVAPAAANLTWRLPGSRGKRRVAALIVLGGGLWNVFWYGLRHFDEFWGITAIGSGAVMIAVAIILPAEQPDRHVTLLLSTLLLGFFLLYLVTLVQLNLGLPIIG